MTTYNNDAQVYSANHNVSIDEAFKALCPIMTNGRHSNWKAFELEGVDSKIGNEFNSSKIMIYCNSLLINGLYNDTIGVYQFGQSGFNGDYSNQFDAVTYNNCEGPNMILNILFMLNQKTL